MSQQTSRSQPTARIHSYEYSGRARAPRPVENGARGTESRGYASGTSRKGAAYTLAHAGRQVRLGPVAFWIAVGTVVIMAVWSITSATYLAFRDDVLRTLITRQAEQQFAYEDRIAELRAQIDRTTSRQLLDQEQFEQKLDDLMRRQSLLESRATALSNGADPATTGSIRPGAKPNGEPAGGSSQRGDRGRQSSIGAALGRLEAALDRVEHRQALAVSQIQDRYENRARQIRSALAQLGLRAQPAAPASGGPFVPAKFASEDQTFGRALLRVNLARADANALSTTLLKVPLRKPVSGDIDESSPFGVRMDPFEAAMHTGIDFRGDTGDPIRATAAGTVTIAASSDGYGKMVEIDHGNGLVTRYGHLSEIDVAIGDTVRAGAIVGKLGSTGRSTGPHLHYEVRVKGEAVDPQKFLDAGGRLFGG
jgi:murein DD-endopeptidase MepM/ murein hydrolase activator NlpD